MATLNPNLNALTGWTDEHSEELLTKAMLGGKSYKLFGLQTGVKGKTALQLMDNEIVFQDGHACGWNDSGSTTFTQRYIDPAILKINMGFCQKNFLNTCFAHKLRVAAGLENLPFEEQIMNNISGKINEGVEKMTYQGESGHTDEFEGLISILTNASAVTKNVNSASGTTAYAFLKAVAAKKPAAVKDAVILVSTPVYEEFMQDLVSANLFHFDPANGDNEYKLPGTNIRVIAVDGLNDTASYDYAILANPKNIVIGVDMEGDEEVFDFWFSRDNDEFRLKSNFSMGVQVGYPEEVVFGKRAK